MKSIRISTSTEQDFIEVLEYLKSLNIVGPLITIGTSMDCTVNSGTIAYDYDYKELNISLKSLESDYIQGQFNANFKAGLLVSVNTSFDIKAGDVLDYITEDYKSDVIALITTSKIKHV